MITKIVYVLLIVLVFGGVSFAWSSTINSMFKSRSIFPISGGLTPTLVESIANGAQMAMDQCKEVFKWDKWNCPQSTFSKQSKHIPTKEVAYAEAIVAAGIVHAITKNCSKGEIKGCGCDSNLIPNFNKTGESENLNSQTEDWYWGGCSDDVTFGEYIVINYLEGEEKESDIQTAVHRHNNRLGRKIIRETLIKKCRCHGISGSCSLQTCWMQLAPFEEVAQKLKQLYHQALQISFEAVKGARALGNSARSVSAENLIEIESKTLLFLTESPNYCIVNNTTDWAGTKGRTCSRSTSEIASISEKKSCRNLCRSCGFKVRKQKRKITFRCNCKFIWCCEVKCDICVETINEYFCD